MKTKTIKLAGILLSMIMLVSTLGAFSIAASAADGAPCTAEGCNGAYANGFCSADGTHYEPATDSDNDGYYEIDNAGKLYWFAEQAEAETYYNVKLTADIVINPGTFDTDGNYTAVNGETVRIWTPIGKEHNGATAYNKIFDGNGYTISGLYVNETTNYNGIFAQAGQSHGQAGFALKNLGLVNSFILGKTKTKYTGSFVGQAHEGSISNCYTNATVQSDMNSGGIIGGVPLKTTEFEISGCFYFGTLSGNKLVTPDGKGYYTRAIASQYWNDASPQITNCYYYGNADYWDTRAKSVSAEQMTSGELAWLLNGSGSEGVWGQNIDNGETKDDYPVLGGAKVNYGYSCMYPESEQVYTNFKTSDTRIDHTYENGVCAYCDGYQPAPLNNNGTADDTTDDYYEIGNAGQLYWFTEQVNAGNYGASAKLTKDIDLNGHIFHGIGGHTKNEAYTGTFDGMGYTVSNLTMNESANDNVGLFNTLNNATVKNFTLTGEINITGGISNVGGVTGQ